MTAPTEAEIREAAYAIEDYAIDIGPWVHELVRPLRYIAPKDDEPAFVPGLWDNLRASEVARLNDLVDKIYEAADVIQADAVQRIRELVVQAALRFAAEYPDAPRAKAEPVPA